MAAFCPIFGSHSTQPMSDKGVWVVGVGDEATLIRGLLRRVTSNGMDGIVVLLSNKLQIKDEPKTLESILRQPIANLKDRNLNLQSQRGNSPEAHCRLGQSGQYWPSLNQ